MSAPVPFPTAPTLATDSARAVLRRELVPVAPHGSALTNPNPVLLIAVTVTTDVASISTGTYSYLYWPFG